MTRTSLEKAKSNLYSLVFTGVGERAMEPEYGTIVRFLMFEQVTEDVYEAIMENILEKASIYIPEIDIQKISFDDKENDIENNRISIKIYFTLKLDPSISDFIAIEVGA